MSKIGLLLRSSLVNDALSAMLMGAGFSVSREPALCDDLAIVIMDFDCPQQTIHTHQERGAKIVVLAREADALEIDCDQIASLDGLLTYDLSADAFARSLRLICSGERVFPRNLALEWRPQAPSPGTEPRSGGDRLSPREREVLAHLLEGHANKLIARHLGITEATVKAHLKNLLHKIRADNRTQAAVWALANLPELNVASRGFA